MRKRKLQLNSIFTVKQGCGVTVRGIGVVSLNLIKSKLRVEVGCLSSVELEIGVLSAFADLDLR